ncbi:helix-turn-helix domain-containing protein [Rathayibacter sp. AY1H2]|uniref:helix-turn-helix domain-containing protein n=1 Tax=Rathayibacter sp. AY1H2 TaxID=2080566 RepID=UPI0011B01320|nr:helix-turn-helix domain-containing protein [Rathayibacter sp. AY1H2]
MRTIQLVSRDPFATAVGVTYNVVAPGGSDYRHTLFSPEGVEDDVLDDLYEYLSLEDIYSLHAEVVSKKKKRSRKKTSFVPDREDLTLPSFTRLPWESNSAAKTRYAQKIYKKLIQRSLRLLNDYPLPLKALIDELWVIVWDEADLDYSYELMNGPIGITASSIENTIVQAAEAAVEFWDPDWIDSLRARMAVYGARSRRTPTITEEQLLALDGLTVAQQADALGCHPRTVQRARARIKQKLATSQPMEPMGFEGVDSISDPEREDAQHEPKVQHLQQPAQGRDKSTFAYFVGKQSSCGVAVPAIGSICTPTPSSSPTASSATYPGGRRHYFPRYVRGPPSRYRKLAEGHQGFGPPSA